jgi:hypothetical protein
MTILKEQVLAVQERQPDYKEAETYYEGDVAERFGNARLRAVMRSSTYTSRLNFCRPVLDAVANRIEIAEVSAPTKANTVKLGEIFEYNQLELDASQIHLATLEYGDAYAIVWPDEDGNVEISYNSPRGTAIVYDPESPKKKLYAVKMWQQGEGTRLNVYYADRIEKYFVQNKNPTEGSNWNLIDTVDNEFGEVPVFHFRTHRPFGRPEHKDAYDAQDYINKQFIQSMVTADYQGAPQRYALSEAGTSNELDDFGDDDTARENVNSLQNGPGELWYLNGVKEVGEFKVADPETFWGPIKNTVRSMASLTYTPLHYFEKTGNVPSGEALRTAEAPLIKKVRNRCASFGQTWREIFKFAMKIEGIDTDVTVKWKEIESSDEGERWDIIAKKRNAGVGLAQALREDGYDEEVIAKIMEEAKTEREQDLVEKYSRSVRATTTHDETNPVQTPAEQEANNNG